MTVDAIVHSKQVLEMTGKCNQPKAIYDASVRKVSSIASRSNWRLSQAFLPAALRTHDGDSWQDRSSQGGFVSPFAGTSAVTCMI